MKDGTTWIQFIHYLLDECYVKNENLINDPEVIEYVYTLDYDYDLIELTCTVAGSFKSNSIHLTKEEFESSNLDKAELANRLFDYVKFA